MPGRASRPTPTRTFVVAVAPSVGVLAAIGWSTLHLLIAGAPVAAQGRWPGVSCLFVPATNDLALHLVSYGFLAAILAGLTSGVQVLIRQRRETRTLLRHCLARRARHHGADAVVGALGLADRLDVADVGVPLAFCYGYIRPRILVSRGLAESLTQDQFAALLIHEREHLRQRDPLKVAVGRLLTATVFFVPALGALYRQFLVEKELAADHAVIGEQGSGDALAAALAVFLDGARPAHPSTAVGAEEALDLRIDALLGEPTRLGPTVGHSPLLGSFAVALLAVLPLLLGPTGPSPADVGEAFGPACHLAPVVARGPRGG